MPRVLCTALGAERGPHFNILRENGFECDVVDRSVPLFHGDGLQQVLDGYDAVIAGSEPFTRQVIEAHPQLRVIARSGVGFDAIDLPACDESGIVVATTPGVNHDSVAEHTLALLLGVARGFPLEDQKVRAGTWQRMPRPRVAGRVLGIIGLGRIGQAVAWRARGIGMQVLATETHPNREFVEQHEIELVPLDDLLARADYVSLHVPVTPDTRHLMNSETLATMKSGAVLINTARGQLVDETALAEALSSGHLRAAGLDVFEIEPLSLESPLLQLNNVLASGHLAGLDDESHAATYSLAARIIVELHGGGWPTECIRNLNGQTGWSWQQ